MIFIIIKNGKITVSQDDENGLNEELLKEGRDYIIYDDEE